MSVKISVDLDGVLVDWVTGYRQLVKELVGVDLPAATTWQWDREVLGKERVAEVWRWIHAHPGWWLRLQSLEGYPAFDRLNQLARRGVDVYFITARPQGTKFVSEQWLVAHGMHCPTVVLARSKWVACAGVGIQYGLDDHEEYAGDCEREADVQMTILDAPYNQAWTGRRVKTVDAWLDTVTEQEAVRED
jgi:uncharacterized HAD superfamily protein